MKKFVRRLLKFALVAALLAAGLSATLLKQPVSHTQYRTEKITRGDIIQGVSVTGTLNPVEVVEIGTQTSGKINKIYVKQNDSVTKGELLAEIDPSLLVSQLKQSKSAMETAKIGFEQAARNLKRMQALVEKDYVARVDLENAQQAYRGASNSYDAAKAQVEKDQINLDYATIYSPIDGVIIEQAVTAGQTMAASLQTPTLFKIARDLRKMKIDVSLPESDIGKVKKDQPVVFNVDAFPDRQFKGIVATVNLSPENQQGVVTYKITVSVDNPDRALVPGMTAFVNIILSEKKGVLRIPLSALRFQPPKEEQAGAQNSLRTLFGLMSSALPAREGGQAIGEGMHAIYLLKHGEVTTVGVKTGVADESHTEVEGANIAEGDEVITGVSSQPQ